MTLFLIALLLQLPIALPDRASLENPAVENPVPRKLQKDYEKLWKRFLTGKEDAKVFSGLDKLLKQSPDAAPVLVVQAYIDLYAGRVVDGERRLQVVLSKHPTDPVAAFYLAELAYSRSDFVRANDLYSRLRASGSPVAGSDMKRQRSLLLAMEALLQDARRAADEGRLADAERFYRQALELAPGEAALHGQLADILQREGKTEEAAAELRLQQQFRGPGPSLLASDNELAVAGFDDLGRWGTQIDRFREIRASRAITREQVAGLLTRYFPQLTEFRQSPEILTDVQDSWAESDIQTVVRAGLLDPMANHTFQPARTVSRGEFAVAVARLTRLLGVSPAVGQPIAPLDVVPDSTLYRELQPVLSYELLILDNAGNFNVGEPVGGEEAVNTAEKLLRLVHKKAA